MTKWASRSSLVIGSGSGVSGRDASLQTKGGQTMAAAPDLRVLSRRADPNRGEPPVPLTLVTIQVGR
jgi:hypothetical protein